MKKLFFAIIALFTLSICFVSCSKCSHKSEEKSYEDTKITKIIKADKEHMNSIDTAYKYFETSYTFSGTIDTLATPDIVEVSSVFQTFNETTLKATVYFSEHFLEKGDSINWIVKENCWWGEDLNLKDYHYVLTVEDAFKLMKASNCIKPQTKCCVLRLQLGPKRCNPQYIFGNDKVGMIFVDAVTSKVTNINPAFGNSKKINE